MHRLSNIDEVKGTALCEECKAVVSIFMKNQGYGKSSWACRAKYAERQQIYNVTVIRPYRQNLKDTCERCGLVPEHECQLDGHHLDGNHDNNDPDNIQTLCANCHRLVTLRDGFDNRQPFVVDCLKKDSQTC